MSVLASVRGGAVHNPTHFLVKERTLKIEKLHIEQFIREKTEIDALTDTEIACLLNVKPTTINHWRNAFGIKPANKFRKNFKEKYGQDAFERLDAIIKNHRTLVAIAICFGFSREYARQVYNQIYSTPISGKTKTRRRTARKPTHR